MMQMKYYLGVAALFLALLFSACTDEAENENGSAGLPPVEEPGDEVDDTPLLEKKIVKILADLGDGDLAEFAFAYNAEGRLVKISLDDGGYGGSDECRITYSGDSLFMDLYSEHRVFAELEDGKAAYCEYIPLSEPSGWWGYDFIYSRGYLSEVLEDGEEYLHMDVVGGNLASMSGDGEMTFLASEVENNANVDLFYFLFGWVSGYDDFWELGFAGALGERYKYLPESISTYEDDPSLSYVYLETFHYETDADGDVTEIIHRAHEGYNSGETVNSYTETYTIVYSEEASNTPDDEEENQPSIIGTWEYSEEIDNIVATERIEFQSDLTGSVTYTEMDEWGEVLYSEGSKFEYSLSTDSEGITYVIIVEEEVSTRYRYDITATRLLLFIDDNSYIEFQKQ